MDHDENCSCHKSVNPEIVQTINEMDFERGIWNAVIFNEIDRLKNFISKGHINDQDNFGYTALHYAARSGNKEICRLLIDGRANLDAMTNGGATPLHRATMMGHADIVEMLLSSGAKIDIQDKDGQTALHRSAANGNLNISKYLLRGSESLKLIKDKKGRTPFDLVSAGNEDLKNLLDPIK